MEKIETFCPFGNLRGPIIPLEVLKSSISNGAKILYGVLCNLAGKKDCCFPRHTILAEMTGCSVSSVKNYLKELQEHKLIFIKAGLFHASTYFLIKPEWHTRPYCAPKITEPKVGYDTETKVDYPQPKVGSVINFNNNIKNNISPLPPTTAPSETLPTETSALSNSSPAKKRGGGNFLSVNQDFEKFWSVYPRKEAKEPARAIWHSLARNNRLPSVNFLLAVLEKFKASAMWIKENGRFVMQCSKWLKGYRWLDENLDASASETPNEKELKEIARKRALQFQAREEESRKKHQERIEKLRPEFEAFFEKFSAGNLSKVALGLWLYLHELGKAPTASNVPENNRLDALTFLNDWKRKLATS